MTPQITIRHLHRRRIGYGRLGDDLVKGLREIGVDVYDAIEGDDGESLKDVELRPGRTDEIMWVSIPTHAIRWLKDQRLSIFTMWEATVLPEQMRENLHSFETVVVPSRQNQELFGLYHPNVQFCPLAIDTKMWKYTPRQEGAYFNFLVAGSGSRKAPDLAAEAFKRAFPDGPPPGRPIPRFIHKSPRGSESFVDYPRDSSVVAGYISDEDELTLYERAHCYIGPSRGEGFGLQPLQAMAQGIPTIVSQGHGHSDFTDLCLSAPTRLVKAGDFMMGDAGQWWEVDVDAFAERMRHVYDNYAEELDQAAWNSSIVAERYTIAALGQRVVGILGKDNLVPYKGDGSWYKPDHRLYRVITNRDWKAEIAEQVIMCDKGVEYWLPADTKRVLYDSGVLDPICIEMEINAGKPVAEWVDTGLTIPQLKNHGIQRQKQQVCMHCGTIAGTGVKASDVIFERLQREAAERNAA